MINIMKLKYISIMLVALAVLAGNKQAMAQKNHYSFERIESMTPWLQSYNAAGLVFNVADENISTVYGYADYKDNGFKNYNEAESVTVLGLGTKSYTRLNNFYFYGRFDYSYTFKENQTWLGTVYENGTIAPMLENVPGKVHNESYKLNARIAYKVSDKSAFGITFDYEDAVAAKKKDGRNSNTFSNLNVSPSYTFASEHVNVGLGLNYQYNVENVNYQYYGEATGLHLYYMDGLFMYTSSTIINTMIKERMYIKNTFGGSAQAELKFGKFSFFNQFTALHSNHDLYEDLGLKKRYAVTEEMQYNYNGIIKFNGQKMENSLHLNYSNKESLLYNISNVYEAIEGENNQWQYNEYGKVLRYVAQSESAGAVYHGFIKKDEHLQNIDFSLGFAFCKDTKTQKLYPSEYNQSIYMRNYFANVNKSISIKDYGYFIIGISGGFSDGNGSMLVEKNPIKSGSISVHKDLVETDFLYKTAERYNIGGSIKYSHTLNADKGMSLWIKADYMYNGITMPEVSSANTEILNHFVEDNRHAMKISVGFNF